MSNSKCDACGKTAYPLESLTAIEKTYHKNCFRCVECKQTLNLKNFKGHSGKIYCTVHYPTSKPTQVIDSVTTKNALNAPKKGLGATGIHKGDSRTAPTMSKDFSVNTVSDQSVETGPRQESIKIEVQASDQSVETGPRQESIKLEVQASDQSVETGPRQESMRLEAQTSDQSTENAPQSSYVSYDEQNPDQSTENDPQGY